MEKMEYILVQKWNNRVGSIVYVPVVDQHFMHFDNEEYQLVVTDSSGIPTDANWADWVYDPESGEFRCEPEVEELSYTDLATGEKMTMTESEFNEMVDEKVRNNVVAVLKEIMDADEELARKILNP